MKRRIISLFLVLTLCLPFVTVPVHAVPALPSGTGMTPINIITSASFGSAVGTMISETVSNLEIDKTTTEHVLNILVGIVGYGQMPFWKLQSKCDILNALGANPEAYSRLIYQEGIKKGYWLPDDTNIEVIDITNYLLAYRADIINWHVVDHPEYGWVIANDPENFIFADALGRFPYANDQEDIWRDLDAVTAENVVNLVTSYSLKDRLSVVQEMYPSITAKIVSLTFDSGLEYQVIVGYDTDRESIWCDYEGKPYAVPLYDTQAGSGRDYNDDTPDQPLVNGDVTVDIDPNFIVQMFPDGSFTWLDNVTYDASNTTYYLDASTSYDVDNNYYYNYEWHYTYHIDYTSITYIGQTAEYDEVYEYYYQLPDGRSSADLTAEELQALNTQIDVLPYIRSADDTSIRALYHFDGDTRDSSYWSYAGEFNWVTGASITYMDAGAFNGALYLDENEHEFSIKLPSNIGSGDFTMQFRYYQSATPAPVSDSSIAFGDTRLFAFDGATIKTGAGYLISNMPVGTWNEIAFVRHAGKTYWYLNGVSCVTGSAYGATVFGDTITFSFGSEQQTFKYFDELRFVNKAVYQNGESYIPSSVPFDTNLSLVLPDSQLPVADGFWDIDSTSVNILADYGLDEYFDSNIDGFSYFRSSNTTFALDNYSSWYGYSGVVNRPSSAPIDVKFPYFGWFSKYTSLNASDSGLLISSELPSGLPYDYQVVDGFGRLISPYDDSLPGLTPSAGLFSLLGAYNQYFLPSGTYTFSVVFDDGTVSSVTFDHEIDDSILSLSISNAISRTTQTSVESNGYTFGYLSTYADTLSSGGLNNYSFLFIRPSSSVAPVNSIVYMELASGDSTDLTAEWVESVVVMDKDDLHTPSLAVRTDLDITGYQIGGVRPSLPTKGLVWALVEAGRISSLQIYNGQAWEEVDGRIWTGSRWVPYYAYDVLLLKDMWDIVEADPTLNPIYTEQGFWSWLQGAWGEMMGKLDQIIEALGGSPGSGDTCAHVYESEISREATCSEPGHMTYTCTLCGHTYVELIDTVGHDWLVTDMVTDDATDYVFVDDVSECTDTSKKYVLPDGYIYEYRSDNFVLPDEYQRLDYIQMTGEQSIYTGVVPTNHFAECVFDSDEYNDDEHLFGTTGSSLYFHFSLYNNRYYWGTNNGYGNYGPWTAGKHTLLFNYGADHQVILDGTVIGSGSEITSSVALKLGMRRVVNFQGKYYSFNLTDRATGELVLQLVPCIRVSDSVAGMYDYVSGRFFVSGTAVPLVAGPVTSETPSLINTNVSYSGIDCQYKELTCSKCGAVSRDYGDGPEEVDLFDVLGDCVSFLYGLLSGTVFHGVSDFFSVFTDGSLFEGFQQTDENGNTTTGLPEGVGAVFADFSGMISALPAELLSVLVFGICLLFLLAVIMLF